MIINLIKLLLIVEMFSPFLATTSSMDIQQSSLECVEVKDDIVDCAIFCEESEYLIEVFSINDTKISMNVPKRFQMDIQTLMFSGENVKHLPQEIHKALPNLREINAVSTSIKIVPKKIFGKFKNLTSLSFVNGELTDICGAAFGDLQSLTSIDLSINEIKFLHPNLFKDNLQLQEIDLGHNSIEILHPKLFSRQEELSVLSLSFNAIIFIDRRQFANNKKLSQLHLDGNNIKAIEYGAFDDLGGLQLLYLHKNPCTSDSLHEDGGMNINEAIKIVNENCINIDESQHEIEEKINMYNNWFRNNYVADKCGSDDKEDYEPFYIESSGVELHLKHQILVLACLVGIINANCL